jgi:hypothetical protein
MRNACKILVRKTEGKTLLGILNFKWGVISILILIRVEVLNWIHLAQDRDQ